MHEERFAEFVSNFIAQNEVDLVLPVGYLTSVVLSKYAKRIQKHTRLLVAEYGAMEIASDKHQTIVFAQKSGVPIPKTYDTPEDVDTYPVVVKGVKDSGRVRYVNAPREMPKGSASEFVTQEYIPGLGFGFYALCNHGEPRAIFMHRRLREYPVTGGASTAAESFRDPVLQDYGTRLLRSLKWHGIAMVEFKRDIRDSQFKLMEVNPKFWGSLDLSIAAGVDFPWLAVRMAMDGDVDPIFDYPVGVRYHWLFPDEVLHVLARPRAVVSVIRDCLDMHTGSNLWLNDIKPNLLQIWSTVRTVVGHLLRRDLRRPHGVPRAVW
jgi:predicted ATP-grasp superfamily ATP-dependent carboligase